MSLTFYLTQLYLLALLSKIRDLTSELIHAKQDILKAQLESREHNTRSQNLLLVDDIENTLLTPPPSSDNEKTERHEINTLQRHAEFLRQSKYCLIKECDSRNFH